MNQAAPERPAGQKRALKQYVELLRAELHLQHWSVNIIWEHPGRADEGSIVAEMAPSGTRYLAELRLGDGFWEGNRESMRSTLVHELLHLHHAAAYRLVDGGEPEPMLRQALGAVAYGMLAHNMNRELELMVDQLTTIIAPHMPLPPKALAK